MVIILIDGQIFILFFQLLDINTIDLVYLLSLSISTIHLPESIFLIGLFHAFEIHRFVLGFFFLSVPRLHYQIMPIIKELLTIGGFSIRKRYDST